MLRITLTAIFIVTYGSICCQVGDPNYQLYPKVKEADVIWARRIWRTIDLREKMNQFLSVRQANSTSKSFLDILKYAIVEKKVSVYDPMFDDFKVKLSTNEINARWREEITRTLEKPFPPYEMYDTLIIKLFETSTVKKIKLKEEWYFNKHSNRLEIRIIGLCPVKENFDALTKEFLGYVDMFWIYFPELRYVLAKEKLYKPFKIDTTTFNTYDDIFMKRYFSSYIYKEDNVFDRQMQDYIKPGLDNFIESERIKEQIRLTEHDLSDD